jgi:hypothetical protein
VVALFVAINLLSSPARAEETDCGLENVKIEYTAHEDAEIACEGVRRALNFFADYGYTDFQHIHVIVVDLVLSESAVENEGNHESNIFCAFYNRIAAHSVITSWKTALAAQRMIFGSIPNTCEYHSSIVAHEVAHNLYHQISESMGKDVERPLTEFVSYVVQIETLNETEKLQVLKLWPNRTFRSIYMINSLVWAMDPNLFAIMSYRYHSENPGFIKAILAGEIISGDKLIPTK